MKPLLCILAACAALLPSPLSANCRTGWYVGGHLGYGVVNNHATELPSPYNGTGHNWSYNSNGAFAGIHGGYEWSAPLTPPAVFVGIEGSLSLANFAGSAPDPLSPNLDTVASTTINSFGMLRGRFGFCWSQTLSNYVTAGVIGANTKLSVIDSCIVGLCGGGLVNATNSSLRFGPTVGVGTEWRFTPNWSISVEVNYFDLGTATASGPSQFGQIHNWGIKTNGYMARFALNFM